MMNKEEYKSMLEGLSLEELQKEAKVTWGMENTHLYFREELILLCLGKNEAEAVR